MRFITNPITILSIFLIILSVITLNTMSGSKVEEDSIMLENTTAANISEANILNE